MKILKHLPLSILISLLISFSGVTLGDVNAVPDYIRNAPDEKDFPDVDGIILKQEITLRLEPDGTVKRHYLTATKILREFMPRSRQCDPLIAYEPGRRPLNIIQALTYMPDGTPVVTQENGFNEITPFELEHAFDFTNFRQMIVTFLGIEHHATMVLEYEINDTEPPSMPFWGELFLQDDKPILSQKVTITIPGDKVLHFQVPGLSLEPVVETLPGGEKQYIFERADVPAANTAEQPMRREYLQRLLYSEVGDWPQLRKMMASRILPAIDTSPGLQQKVKELTAQAGTTEEKIYAVHAFVVDHCRTIDWPLSDFHFKPRSASDVFSSGYGHVLDKAVLLMAMLKESSLPGEFFLVSPSVSFSRNVVTPVQLNDAWIRIVLDNEMYMLSPTGHVQEKNRFTLPPRPVYSLQTEKPFPSPLPSPVPADSLRSLTGDITVEKSETGIRIAGDFKVDLTGGANPAIPFSTKDNVIEELAEKIAAPYNGNVGGVEVAKRSRNQTSFSMAFDEGSLDLLQDHPAVLELPALPAGIHWKALQLYRKNRTTPLFLPFPFLEHTEISLSIPSGIDVLWLPQSMAVQNEVGEFLVEVRKEEDKIKMKKRLIINIPVIMPEQYNMLRDIFTAMMARKNNVVLLQPAEKE